MTPVQIPCYVESGPLPKSVHNCTSKSKRTVHSDGLARIGAPTQGCLMEECCLGADARGKGPSAASWKEKAKLRHPHVGSSQHKTVQQAIESAEALFKGQR